MAIIWYDTTKRLTSLVEPLNRAGYLEKKTVSVDRVYDHLSFSYREGAPDMKLLIRSHGKEIIVTKPHCTLCLPGEHFQTVPLSPCNEFYFVFQHPERIFGDKIPDRGDFGLLYPSKDSIFFSYMETFLKLFNGVISPCICTQLDCLAVAILSTTFYGESSHDHISPIEAIEGYINNHYTENIDFEELAGHYGMSFSTFRRQWKAKNAEPPGQMVLRLRNRTAIDLLRNRRLSIGEIAGLSGFSDIRYFSRFFRRMNGMTPSEYRNALFKTETGTRQ